MKQRQVGIYARVSSEQQAEAHTIESQISELLAQAKEDGAIIADELRFIDDGYSGTTLVRPALERLRDTAAMGGIEQLYVHNPDRLARKYAYQVLLLDELQRIGVEVIFLNRAIGQTPEDHLLLQVQGMIAEYEHAKILERSRRGKRHAAQAGKIAVLGGAPYGYRYITKAEGGGEASYEIIPEQARVVRHIFYWIGVERATIGDVRRKLEEAGELTKSGKTKWDRSVIWGMLQNPAYKGQAAFGKTRSGPMRERLRPQRNGSMQPRNPVSTYDQPQEDWLYIPVPAIIDEALFEAVHQQLAQNRRTARQRQRGARYFLQGLIVCAHCRYAYYGKPISNSTRRGKPRDYAYYRCIGTDAYRFGGERVCHNRQVRTDTLDQLVWDEVRGLLENGERLKQEYQRRLERPKQENPDLLSKQTQLLKIRRGMARLIDSYADGFIEKAEFESRITRFRQRVVTLETQLQEIAEQQALEEELHSVVSRLEDFAAQVTGGLDATDWDTRRQLLRILVKRVEIGEDDVNIVFRIPPDFDRLAAHEQSLQHCRRSGYAALWDSCFRFGKQLSFHDTGFKELPNEC